MHNRHDHDAVWTDPEENAERKCLNDASSHIEMNYRIQTWIDLNMLYGILYRQQETFPQIFLLRLIINRGT